MAIRRPTPKHHQTPDDRWDQQMSRILRDAAEVREERERARLNADDLSARREASALMLLIASRDRPKAGHHAAHRGSRTSPEPAREQT